MSVFVDTSAFLAILNAGDQFHESAKNVWRETLSSPSAVITSNYIILETTALLQHRFGIEAIRLLESDILPVIEIMWITETCHKRAVSALLAANRRQLSLVDCTSFEIMREEGLDTAFTFDPHFHEQGFTVTPPFETES
jgi:predicted nucleic acid-binding protein